MMIVNRCCSNSGKDLILEYINSLSKEERVDAFSVLEYLKKGEMDKINYKCWKKKIYEVYFYKNNRIYYVISDKNNLYLLHACRKQKNKTEKKDSKIIIKRAKKLGKMLGRTFY